MRLDVEVIPADVSDARKYTTNKEPEEWKPCFSQREMIDADVNERESLEPHCERMSETSMMYNGKKPHGRR